MLPFVGYDSSSVVDTIGTLRRTMVSIWGRIFASDELVQRTTTSGFEDLMAFCASLDTLMRSWRPRPATSPRSRPAFPGSISTAPTILNPLRAATCLTTPVPIGPRPKCRTLMGPDADGMNAPEKSAGVIRRLYPPGPG